MFDPRVQAVMDKVDGLRKTTHDAWQVPREEALLLAQIVRMGRCTSLCEIGVSYGFSTLHLAAATHEHGGHIHAFDISPKKVKAATAHLGEAGLAGVVTIHLGDARELVKTVAPAKPYDFAFIVSVRPTPSSHRPA